MPRSRAPGAALPSEAQDPAPNGFAALARLRRSGEQHRRKLRFSVEALEAITRYHWPGNIRELENAVEHAFVTCPGGLIGPLDLPLELRRADLRPVVVRSVAPDPGPPARRRPATREQIVEALESGGWNKAEAARRLGITRTQLWRRMTHLGIPLSPTATPNKTR